MMCTSDQVVKFFEYSPKKQTVLEKLIDETVNDETSRTELKQLCRTRWVERHDAFSVFLDFFPAIVQTLEHFTKLPNTRTPGAADGFSSVLDVSSLTVSSISFSSTVCFFGEYSKNFTT
jgi:hypothetical protein